MKRLILISIFFLFALGAFAQGSITSTKQVRFFPITSAGDTTATGANDGRMWYDFATDEFRGIKEGVAFSFGSGSAGGDFWPLDDDAAMTANVTIESGGFDFLWDGSAGGNFSVRSDNQISAVVGEILTSNIATLDMTEADGIILSYADEFTSEFGSLMIDESGGVYLNGLSNVDIVSQQNASLSAVDNLNIAGDVTEITAETFLSIGDAGSSAVIQISTAGGIIGQSDTEPISFTSGGTVNFIGNVAANITGDGGNSLTAYNSLGINSITDADIKGSAAGEITFAKGAIDGSIATSYLNNSGSTNTATLGYISAGLTEFSYASVSATGVDITSTGSNIHIESTSDNIEIEATGGASTLNLLATGSSEMEGGLNIIRADLSGIDIELDGAGDFVQISQPVGGTSITSIFEGEIQIDDISGSDEIAINDEGIQFTGTASPPQIINATGSTSVVMFDNVLYTSTASSANVGTGNTTIYTFSIPAATLFADGQSLKIEVWFDIAANTNVKSVSITIGGTTVASSGTLNVNTQRNYKMECIVTRTGATTGLAMENDLLMLNTAYSGTGSISIISGASITWANANTVNVVAASATASNDITGRFVKVSYLAQ